jgi:hypothetical protein
MLLLLSEGCGDRHSAVSRAGSAELQIEQTVNRGGPVPIEGAYSYVRVETPAGDKVAEERLGPEGTTKLRLNRGRYTLISYQRTCDGNCSKLDPPSDSCSRSFDISSDKALAANVRVTFGSGCTIGVVPGLHS